MRIIILLSLLLTGLQAHSYVITTGTYVPYFKKAQTDAGGDTKFLEINPSIGFGMQFNTPWGHFFTPEIGYVMHRNTIDNVEKHTIYILYGFAMRITNTFLFRYGLGTFQETQTGGGGAIYLNNGNGYTAFYEPSEEITTYNTNLLLGVELFTDPKISIKFDLAKANWTEEIFAFENLNYLLTVNFYL